MPAISLKNLDVNALLELRANVESTLADRGRDLHRQLALLGGHGGKRPGRPAGRTGRTSAMKGVKVAPKYRGPGGETWAGRGATPRWLSALIKEGHSLEEFRIGAGRKAKLAAAKKSTMKKKGRKPAAKTRGRGRRAENAESAAAGG